MRNDGVNSIDFEGKRARELAEQSSTMDAETQEAYIEHELLNEQVDRVNAAWEERTGRKYISQCERSYLRTKQKKQGETK